MVYLRTGGLRRGVSRMAVSYWKYSRSEVAVWAMKVRTVRMYSIQRFFIQSCIYLRILIISDLATFLGTNSLSVLMCHKAVNQSISTGIFPDLFKNCSVHPHLKKSNLDKDYLSNYPISHLSFLSKLTERVVRSRLADYLCTNNLLNSFQSAHIKHHSTKTTLLSVQDHIIKARVIKKSLVSHFLIYCCFWYIILLFLNVFHPGLTFLLQFSWIKSYLLNRFFYVNLQNSQSSVFQLHYPQGTMIMVIGPWSSTLHLIHHSSQYCHI